MENKYKEKNKIKIIILKQKTKVYHLILFVFIIIRFIPILNFHILNSQDSYITLKFSGEGEKKVYNEKIKPDEVYIDEENKAVTNKYYLNSENIVKLVWKNPVTSCESMFRGCSDIIEMNLTYFDTSYVKSMIYMFSGCNNLKSLDISNIDTSNVTNMGIMFEDCHSLISLDVSHFNTSKVENIGAMFKSCKSLKSLDITNYDISKVKYLDNLFNGCFNLTSIDLSNFAKFSDVNKIQPLNNSLILWGLEIFTWEISKDVKD